MIYKAIFFEYFRKMITNKTSLQFNNFCFPMDMNTHIRIY